MGRKGREGKGKGKKKREMRGEGGKKGGKGGENGGKKGGTFPMILPRVTQGAAEKGFGSRN